LKVPVSHKSSRRRQDDMTTFAIIGGTGTVGSHIVDALRAADPTATEVRVLSRSSAGYPVDLTTGTGLAEALAGCDLGIDQVPSRYYRAKLAQEETVKTAERIPSTIVHSTQFHELVEAGLRTLAKGRLSPRPPAPWAAGHPAARRPDETTAARRRTDLPAP
jgi:hypothetical protein